MQRGIKGKGRTEMLGRMVAVAVVAWVSVAGAAQAEGRQFALAVAEELEAAGLAAFLVPRFSLKHGIRVARGPAGGAGPAADAYLVPSEAAGTLEVGGSAVFRAAGAGGATYVLALAPGSANLDNARVFRDWILSDIGQRTVASFRAPDGDQPYLPGGPEAVPEPEALPEGDIAAGEKLALFHCGRCHVVNEKNRMGGIGSTPSFGALRAIEDWRARFLNFWDLNPHPSFTQVEGLTEPFDPARPPHIAPVEITREEMQAIVAFAASIPPKDLGPEINMR